MRLVLGTPILLMVWRPRARALSMRELLLVAGFGLTIAVMNLSFYAALDRIPLGVAVTLEFVGPLSLGLIGFRRASDLIWVTLAAAGVALLAPWGGLSFNPWGTLLAVLAGACWAVYILLSARVGRIFHGGQGLAMAMLIASLAIGPIGVAVNGTRLLEPRVLALGAGVALLSAVIPYSLELEALRTVPTQVFGVLMSTEPAVASLVGFVFLQQTLAPRAILAIALISVAALGSSRRESDPILD